MTSTTATMSITTTPSVAKTPFARCRILGRDMDVVTGRDVLERIRYLTDGRRKAVIANHNLHSLYLVQRQPEMARIYEMADLIQIDSMPLIRFARLTGKAVGPEHRSTYLDWRDDFWTMCQRYGLRVFYLGGEPGVATGAVRMLEMAYPDIRFAGRDGFFDATREGAENQSVLSEIRRFAPDVLMVGMGMPRQENWIVDNYSDLPPCVMLPVGAAFDYEVGAQKPAPRWMGEWGVEWLYRLCHDPKRLASRYLVEPWFLVKPALKDLLKQQ